MSFCRRVSAGTTPAKGAWHPGFWYTIQAGTSATASPGARQGASGSKRSTDVNVPNTKWRSRLFDKNGCLVIIIPVKRDWTVIFIMLPFVLFLTYSLAIDMAALIGGVRSPSMFAIMMMLGFDLFLDYSIAWNLAGAEVLTIDNTSLTKRRRLLGITIWPSQCFDLRHVQRLRAGPTVKDLATRQYESCGIGIGDVYFDYGVKTYGFGLRLGVAEAERLIQEIGRVFNSADHVDTSPRTK